MSLEKELTNQQQQHIAVTSASDIIVPIDVCAQIDVESSTGNEHAELAHENNDVSSNEVDVSSSSSDPSPVSTVQSRSSCRYGADCYRTNIQHKSMLSHPGDPDYVGEVRCDSTTSTHKPAPVKPNCWYGRRCYRKNDEHLEKFNHPSESTMGSENKRKRRVRIDVTCRIDNANDSDEYDSSFIDDDECNELSLAETESDEENFTDSSYDSTSDEDDHDHHSGRKKKMLKFSLF